MKLEKVNDFEANSIEMKYNGMKLAYSAPPIQPIGVYSYNSPMKILNNIKIGLLGITILFTILWIIDVVIKRKKKENKKSKLWIGVVIGVIMFFMICFLIFYLESGMVK